jgi:pSer/pThr/pTyr-binding forkhead associated (FHA) protein
VGQETVGVVNVSRSILMGRSDECDIAFHNDRLVSRRHCRLEGQRERWEVIDLESTSGTLVNGQRISRHLLRDGDVFVLGPVSVEFHLEAIDLAGAITPGDDPCPILTVELPAGRERGGGESDRSGAGGRADDRVTPGLASSAAMGGAGGTAIAEPPKRSRSRSKGERREKLHQVVAAAEAQYDESRSRASRESLAALNPTWKDRINQLPLALKLAVAIVVALSCFGVSYYFAS